MQSTQIIGNLTADPVARATPSGKDLCTFTVAVNEKYGDKDEATFFNCTAWGKRSEPILRYLHKSDKVYIEGKVRARVYKTKEGEAKASLDLTVNTCEFLVTQRKGEAYDDDIKNDGFVEVKDDDMPF